VKTLPVLGLTGRHPIAQPKPDFETYFCPGKTLIKDIFAQRHSI